MSDMHKDSVHKYCSHGWNVETRVVLAVYFRLLLRGKDQAGMYNVPLAELVHRFQDRSKRFELSISTGMK